MLNKSALLAIAALAASMSIHGYGPMPKGYKRGPMPKGYKRGPKSKGGNPAGSKLARKAAKGRLGLR